MSAALINREKALIFRITHVANVPWILANGVCSRSSSRFDPSFRPIGSPDLIEKRAQRRILVGSGGTLADYVPFYFTPWSPMLLNIKTGKGVAAVPMPEIVFLVSSVPTLAQRRLSFVISDRHAYLETARLATDVEGLGLIDWPLLQARDFRKDRDDPGRFERYQAETLVHSVLPIDALVGIACHGQAQKHELDGQLKRCGVDCTLAVRPEWYFE